jgi:hypothetical protein
MTRKPANELELGDIIFLGPERIRSRVVTLGEECQTNLVVPELRKYVASKKLVSVFVQLSRSTVVEETGFRANFFTVFLDPFRLVSVADKDSQRRAA